MGFKWTSLFGSHEITDPEPQWHSGPSVDYVQQVLRENENLRQSVTRASAELRHAFRQKSIDSNLVARAIKILEESLMTPEQKAYSRRKQP